MALTVKRIALWRKEVAHTAGALADVLTPLADAGVNLRLVMGYGFPTEVSRAAIEVFPISGKTAAAAAASAGLTVSPIPCLHVEGDDRPGLGGQMARAIADKGINISFVMAETVGRKFSAVFGFQSDADAATAAKAIRSAGAKKPRRR